jgi:hypothetical protein
LRPNRKAKRLLKPNRPKITAIENVVPMQRFIAELSTVIDRSEFEESWGSNQGTDGGRPKVGFTFTGRRVSAVIESDVADRWPSASFYQTFSAAVRRIDSACNIRWL